MKTWLMSTGLPYVQTHSTMLLNHQRRASFVTDFAIQAHQDLWLSGSLEQSTAEAMAVRRRGSSSAGGLLVALTASALMREGFVCGSKPEHVVPRQVAQPNSPSHSRRFIMVALALLARAEGTAAEAAPIQYNAQLAGDLSEAQKKDIKAYLERHRDTPAADVVVGKHELKVYVKPTAEELTPGSPEFKAGR